MPVTFSQQLSSKDGSAETGRFFRLPPPSQKTPYKLEFVLLAGSPALQDGTLKTNYPAKGAAFARDEFRAVPFVKDARGGDGVATLEIALPGVFAYHVEFSGPDGRTTRSENGGRFVVDPVLRLAGAYAVPPPSVSASGTLRRDEDEVLPLDGIACLTVVPKWLPPLHEWEAHFRAASRSSYNMVHFAPLQERGASDSPYSIYDQLALSRDLFRGTPTAADRDELLSAQLATLRREHRLLSITDIVLNHTANNSAWLQEHPEAGYNLENSPHLRPAAALDDALVDFSEQIFSVYGLAPQMTSEDELNQIMSVLQSHVIPKLRLWEFFVADVAGEVSRARAFLAERGAAAVNGASVADERPWTLSGDARAALLRRRAMTMAPGGGRYGLGLSKDIGKALAVAHGLITSETHATPSPEQLLETLETTLNEVNLPLFRQYDDDVGAAMANIANRARYLRLAPHGPRLGAVSRAAPLVDTYFTRLPTSGFGGGCSADQARLANNGWIWNADPLVDFAGPQSRAYFRREVIAWGDCVKLRYGASPADSPWLWEHMTAYARKLAGMFDGFRIDNCHSTPLHVAERLLDAARLVNPNLYVIAELFTGSEATDVEFVGRLGINSLIREAMQAWDSFELSRLAHRHGGQPVGSLRLALDQVLPAVATDATVPVSVAQGSRPHALFMDCTHDNEPPSQKRTAQDTLANAAVVAMSCCAMGSVRGYDELVPQLLDLVRDRRRYAVPRHSQGIVAAKAILCHLHEKMAREGFCEIHVHHEHEFISIHRMHPVTHDGYLLIARTAFGPRGSGGRGHAPIRLRNTSATLALSARLQVDRAQPLGLSVAVETAAALPDDDADDGGPTRVRHARGAGYDSDDAVSVTSSFNAHRDNYTVPSGRPGESRARHGKLLSPVTPAALYHSFSQSLDELLASGDTGGSASSSMSSLGRDGDLIRGLASELELSTSLTNLVQLASAGTDGADTVVTVDMAQFAPGSIVVLRTTMEAADVNCSCSPSGGCSCRDEAEGETPIVVAPETPDRRRVTAGLRHVLGLGDPRRNAAAAVRAAEVSLVLGNEPLTSARQSWNCLETFGRRFPGLTAALDELDLDDLNVLLYRAHEEEADWTDGAGVYDVPGHGPLAYCGLQGFVSVLEPIARSNNLGHALCSNLRAGMWALEYLAARLKPYLEAFPRLCAVQTWLTSRAALLRNVPGPLAPKYFSLLVLGVYHAARARALKLLGRGADADGSLVVFADALALGTVQLGGRTRSAGLFPTPDIYPVGQDRVPRSLAAGLPHFATNHMRCWGRDVFIALRGLYLLTGRFGDARAHLLAFGSTMRHGLIPNLLDSGRMPRFNARDAVWWWLYAVQEYCRLAPEGLAFLLTPVRRRFPPLARYAHDSSKDQDTFVPWDSPQCYAFTSTMGALVHEALERHASGISFREWNAGPKLDHAMSAAGFDISIHAALSGDGAATGFVYGGNAHNCGTWMDKMGDSALAGNAGIPATPRDGAPVEITGLLKATLRWLAEVHTAAAADGKRYFPFDGVERAAGGPTVTWAQWDALVQAAFERHYHVPQDPAQDAAFAIGPADSSLVNRRGIYRDVVGPTQPFASFQLRPNFCVAMVVAPELFELDHALAALEKARELLAGPLGMRTLDPADWAFRGTYDNANDSADYSTAHGFNYHQGPEWLWVMAYFLRAYLLFHTRAGNGDHARTTVSRILTEHRAFLLDAEKCPHAGLPELTQAFGAPCAGSCLTQAWSNSCFFELTRDLGSSVGGKF